MESILLNVPLPLVYTAEEEGGKEVVIDGQQRLTTCFAFIDGFFPLSKKDEERESRGEEVRRRPFRLKNLKILRDLDGKRHSDLDEATKNAFNKFTIPTIKISKDSHPVVKFEIFERLNTGSVTLSDQELRNCIFRGSYNDLINDLAKDKNFQTILGVNNPVARMQDVELVLRFLAFNEVTYLNYNDGMRTFLNNHMKENRTISPERENRYKEMFYKAIELSFTVFGEKAFRRYSPGSPGRVGGSWEKALNKAVYDVIMFWFAHAEKRLIIERKDAIREAFIQVCSTNREFGDAITLGTADKSRVKTRFEIWNNTLNEIIGPQTTVRRLYSFSEKKARFDEDRTCGICSQQIEHMDDAEMDHIVPYSQGGSTDLSNARLTHRYCNRSRGAG